MRHIRWFRLSAAIVLGVPAVGLAAMGVTRPSPSAVARSTPGVDACRTDEVLQAGLPLREDGRLAADVLLAASRCGSIEAIDWQRQFEVFELARDGLGWMDDNEHGDVALDHALDVWELAADQRRVGDLVNVGVWTAVGTLAGDRVEEHLSGASAAARLDASRRLVAIATAPLDWDEVLVRDERTMWEVAGRMVTTPSAWVVLLGMPRMVVQARRGTHVIVAEIRDDEAVARVEAAVLAGAAELSLDLDGAECPSGLAVERELRAAGIELTVDPELCVVAGVHGSEIRMASPRPTVAAGKG